MQRISDTINAVALWLAVGLLTTACATWHPAPHHLTTSQWSIEPPKGWMHRPTPEYDMLSKDGPYLQYILIQARPLAQRFRFTRHQLNAQMLPHEVAQVIEDNLRNDGHIKDLQIVTSEPARLGGHDGFKITYTYRDGQDVTMRTVYYGVVRYGRFINLRYTAAQRHYFEKDLSAFDQVYQSLTLLDTHQP